MAKAQKTEKEGGEGKRRFAGKIAKVIIPVTAISLSLSPTVSVFAKESAITKEMKQPPKTDAAEFKGWLEEGWAQAKVKFGKVLPGLELPGRITVKSLPKSGYQLELSADGYVESFPTVLGGIIIRANSSDSLSVRYSDDMPLSKEDAHRLAAYSYLAAALSTAPQGEYASFYPDESVPLLYSGLGMKDAGRSCTTGEALSGFAAFLSSQSDPLLFLGFALSGDTQQIKKSVDLKLGKGAWQRILYAKQDGSTEICEAASLLLKTPEGKKRLSEYLSFMEDSFGLDAGTVKYMWSESGGRWLTLRDAAK
ncbi:Uncharacterised protein [uncultured archaeon]|nr:Uncharacterised protein [uncultured archaeon]